MIIKGIYKGTNMDSIIISIKWDKDANVWIATNSTLGLVLESGSYDALVERVKNAIPELAELNNILPGQKYILKTSNRLLVGACIAP